MHNIYWCVKADQREEWDRDYLLHQAQLEDTRKMITTTQQTETYSTLQSGEDSGQNIWICISLQWIIYITQQNFFSLLSNCYWLFSLFCFLVINEVSLNLVWTSQWFLTTVALIIEEVSKGVLHPQRITRTTSGDRVTLTMTRTEQQTHCTDMPQWMTVGVKVSVDQFEKEFTGGNVLLCATHWLCLLWGLWRADNLFSPS